MTTQENVSNEKQRILIVEDDQRLASLTKEFLENNGYEVSVEEDGAKGAARILDGKPDLVILDLMLPGEDGLSICRKVRSDFPGPILMLTARTDDMDHVVGLEVGADDYVTKPVRPQVLLARIRALLRRTDVVVPGTEEVPTSVELSGIHIDSSKRQVWVRGDEAEFTSAEFDLLWMLMANAGQILSREDILGTTRGIQYDGLDRTIDVRISKIRKKIGDDTSNPQRIKTVRSKGYIFVKDE